MKKLKLTAMILAGTMLAGAVTACGSSDSSETSAQESKATVASSENSSETSGNTSLEKVTFMLDWTPNTNHTGIYVAEELGYFAEEGLDVSIVEAADSGAEASVAGGAADMGVSFQDYLVPAYAVDEESRLPITTIATIIQHNTSGIVSLKKNGIDSPKKMEGFKYATWETPIEQAIVKKVVTDDGGDASKVEMIPATVTDINAGLNSEVDAVWIYYAWDGISCELQGMDTNFFYFKDYAPELDEYSPIIIANNDFLKTRPEVAKKFLAAVSKGYEYAIENPEEAAKILVKVNEGLDEELCIASQKWLADQYKADASKWGVIDQSRWDAFYKWVYENGLCDREIPEGFGFTNEYLPE